ncbi:unnamed protein product [Rhizoctonia solani]|uniref:Uncharacterized protein n=1 Tax=Rhizoctonia solani TaxID=456999 RepID=A0A8H3AD32_9AGAM|nr:unnamed protein product [Rhizoctonia solani]
MAWWLAFAADGMLEIVVKLPSALRPELRACIGDADLGVDRKRIIVTPFPLTEHSHKQSPDQPGTPGLSIVELLLEIHGSSEDAGADSIFAMRLKSIAFVGIAGLLSDDYRAGQSFDQTISTFIDRLPNLTYYEPPVNDEYTKSDMILVYMLAYLAKLRLHSAFSDNSQTCLNTALLVGQLASGFNAAPPFSMAAIIAVSSNT